MKQTAAALLLLLPFSAAAGEPDVQTCSEVKQLIEFVRTAPCEFNRNGSWYDAGQAAEHIGSKYRAALAKDQVHSAEDFIEYAASRSSLTGAPYKVRCEGGPATDCAVWLTAELRRVRGRRQ